jgi:hypothetical protein
VLAPDDPAIDDIRDLAGISRRPDDAIKRELDMALIDHEQANIARDSSQLGLAQQEKDLNAPPPKGPQ